MTDQTDQERLDKAVDILESCAPTPSHSSKEIKALTLMVAALTLHALSEDSLRREDAERIYDAMLEDCESKI